MRCDLAYRLRLLWAPAVLVAGCAAQSGEGDLSVRLNGEEASRSGYPVGEGDAQIAFVDGWSMEFHKVLVSLGGFSLATAQGEAAAIDADSVVADLHQGQPELWYFAGVAARRWDRVGYRYEPPTESARSANDVDDADLERMRAQGYSLWIEATARKDEREVELAWGFALEVEMSRCENGLDGTDGIVVRDNAAADGEITVHLDHLFFDDWAVQEPDLRFDAMAAMAPDDGPLSVDDLAGQDNLSDLRGPDGEPLGLGYDPGSAFHPVPQNLAEFVTAAAVTTGHWNGEGHCEYKRR